ncbi:MAG: hypothetical protein DRJ61_07995 [Acidobacteria bacterium]|nr:MAG: hypothetical protein DRJ61_07995 [Acidobacteriota bacterium]
MKDLRAWFCRAVLVVVMLVSWVGCRAEVPAKPLPLRVHVIVAGDADQEWNQGGAAIEQLLKETFGAVTTSARVHTAREKLSALEAAGRHELEVVLCFGSGFERPVQAVAPRFPRTAFVLDHGDFLGPNVARIEFLFGGAAYLGGVVAAVVGGSIVGIVGPGSGPGMGDIEAGFEQGFRCRYPWGRVELTAGAGGIETLPDAGVKIALWSVGSPNPGVLAVAEASGVRLVTIGRSRQVFSSNMVIAAIIADVPEAIRRIVADVVDDTFTGKVYAFDLGSGVVDLRLHPSLAEIEELDDALDQARDAVNAGMVEVESLGL